MGCESPPATLVRGKHPLAAVLQAVGRARLPMLGSFTNVADWLPGKLGSSGIVAVKKKSEPVLKGGSM
jgi:hypothetical protein